MTERSHAVFLSYASQDAEAARRICDALRGAGIEVWFDQSELRGGDAWDAAIRKQIKACSLFIPVISANAHARVEGYFRLEWKLAIDRSYLIAPDQPFLLPVVIDQTPQTDERIPDRFRELQWSRLPGGQTPLAFVEHVTGLRSPEAARAPAEEARSPTAAVPYAAAATGQPASNPVPSRQTRWLLLVIGAIAAIGVGYFAVDKFVLSKRPAIGARISVSAGQSNASAQSAIPEKSIAVLPFVDLSEKHDQEYFADGMADELLDLLAQVPDLRVPARTSSFYFKGKQVTLAEIARALSVAHVLEGSVRRSGKTIRVTVQLIRADSGYHLWSKTYDRDFEDVLKVQDDIATSIVGALRASLLEGRALRAASAVNSEAYTLYLQAHALRTAAGGNGSLAIDYLRKSIKLDPTFALARAELAAAIASEFSTFGILPYAAADTEARAAAEEAIRLDPQLPLAHLALARLYSQIEWDWDAAESEIGKVIEVEPGNAEAYRVGSYLATTRGRFDEAINLSQRAVSLDPLYAWNYIATAFAAYRKHDYARAEGLYRKAIQLSPSPTDGKVHYLLGSVLLMRGQPTDAFTEMDRETDPGFRNCGLALAFYALGREREANRELAVAEKDHAKEKPYWIALIYALRKDADNSFLWLDRAARQHDPGMLWIKGDPMLDGLVGDPRYKVLLRKMNLPE